MSFEVWGSRIPHIEVFGTAGTISVPDPNRFSDPVEILLSSDQEWTTVGPLAGYADAARGYGLADMARAIATDRPHRASGELAFHVLEIMDAIARSGESQETIELSSTVERPAPVPLGARPESW